MTNTINNVPRELEPCPFCGKEAQQTLSSDLVSCAYEACPAFLLAVFPEHWNTRAPSPACVDGLEVVAWQHWGDRTKLLCALGKERGIPGSYTDEFTQPLCRLSDAKAIIDGLRGEVAEERAKVAQLEEGIPRIMEASYQFRQQRDQLAGLLRDARELITHGVFEYGVCCCGSSVESHGFGDGHSPVDALAYCSGQVCERIDAALSAGKEGE